MKFIRMKVYPGEVYPDEVLSNRRNFIRMKFYPDENLSKQPPGGKMGKILSDFEKLANVQPRLNKTPGRTVVKMFENNKIPPAAGGTFLGF